MQVEAVRLVMELQCSGHLQAINRTMLQHDGIIMIAHDLVQKCLLLNVIIEDDLHLNKRSRLRLLANAVRHTDQAQDAQQPPCASLHGLQEFLA